MSFPTWLEYGDLTETLLGKKLESSAFNSVRAWTILLFSPFWFLAFGSAQTAPTPIQTTEQSASLHGVVVNANTNQPVPRALVQVERQSILTGHDGKFEFSNLSGTTVSVKAIKPGFYESIDPYQSSVPSLPVGSAEEAQIRLYPESILAGTLTASNGDPLPQVQVEALRRVNDEAGGRWMMGGQTSTNSDGEFRLAVPGGDYVIETQYAPPRSGLRLVMLPLVFPAGASNASTAATAATIHLPSGSEQHLELHPALRPNHTVHVEIDGAESSSDRGFRGQGLPQVQARLTNGLAFYPAVRGGGKPGEAVINLPSGSYVLSATSNGRDDGATCGETKLTVADEDVTGVSIHMQPAAELTIEASVDPTATATNSTAAAGSAVLNDAALERQLGLYFERTDAGINLGTGNIGMTQRRGGQMGFSLLPGTYRLRSTTFNSWYIESATIGGTDLLSQELVVSGGSSSLPMRIVAGSASATVKGTVKLAGTPARSWVYLLAATPSTSPIIDTRSGQDGTFTRSLLPPGTYHVLASESRSFLDLTDPAIQRRFASYLQTVTVGTGETERVDLTAVPAAEWKP